MKHIKTFFFLIAFSLILLTPIVVKYVWFVQNCSGYLKQAADANSIELCKERLDIAIDYLESHDLTNGYTSVLYKTEDENIEYWYRNLKTCQKELQECIDNDNTSQLEKSNLLLKVRETLTDNTQNGTEVTIPHGISRYPHNLAFGIIRIIAYCSLIISIIALGL